jgi:hypothetical protein
MLKFDPANNAWTNPPYYWNSIGAQKVAVLAVTKDDMIMLMPYAALNTDTQNTATHYIIASTKGTALNVIMTLPINATLAVSRHDEPNNLLWLLVNTGTNMIQWVLNLGTASLRQMDSAVLSSAKPELFVAEPYTRIGTNSCATSNYGVASSIIFTRENY